MIADQVIMIAAFFKMKKLGKSRSHDVLLRGFVALFL